MASFVFFVVIWALYNHIVPHNIKTPQIRGLTICTNGGEGGIRTPETGEGLLAFQASALDHYATSPSLGQISENGLN